MVRIYLPVFLFLLCMPLTADAGLISSLLKASKKADVADSHGAKLNDIDLHHLNLDLPSDVTPDVLMPKLDANRRWVFKDKQGVVADITAFDNPALLMGAASIPNDLKYLDSLPRGVPLLIREKSMIFQLQKQGEWRLSIGNVGIGVSHYEALKKAIWHFKSPWSNGPVRVLGLKDKAAHSLALRVGVEATVLKQSPSQLRGQTIILSGPVKLGEIKVDGVKFSLDELRKNADKYDISLVILESVGKVAPKSALKYLSPLAPGGKPLSTGEFLHRFKPSGADINYSVSPSGKSQVLLAELRPVKSIGDDVRATDIMVEVAAQTASRVSLLRPDKERQQELNLRLIPWLPSWFIIYFGVSFLAGFWVFHDSRDTLRALWHTRARNTFPHLILYLCFKSLRLLVLVGLIIPVLGLPLAIKRVVMNIYYMVKLFITTVVNIVKFIARPFV